MMGGRESGDYIAKVTDIWNGRDFSVRNQPSVLSQIRCIEKGHRLSMFERKEIERKVLDEVDRDSEDEIMGNDNVDFEIQDRDSNISVSETSEIDNEIPPGMNSKFDIVIDRINTFVDGATIRILTEEEKGILDRLRQVFASSDVIEIPSLKDKDRTDVLREVTIVNRLLHNVHIEEPDVTKVNRLLYAGSYIVCERLGVLEKRKNVKQTNKPWWQRRLEGSISQ